MSSVLPTKRRRIAAGQPDLFGAVLSEGGALSAVGRNEVSYREKPVGHPPRSTVLPLERRLVGQAGPSSTPASAGGTPAEPGRSSKAGQRRSSEPKRVTGREAGGLACVGCKAYRSKRNPSGGYTGRGWCFERERDVHAVYRGACGLYEFHTTRLRGVKP